MDYVYYPDYLEHHGILGQKWGVRRYQDENGSYTKEGLERRKNGLPKGIGIHRFTDKKGNVSKEGKAHYARKDSPYRFSENTKDRGRQGAKIGAAVYGGINAIGTAAGLGIVAASGMGAAALGTAFCTGILNTGLSAAGGAISGWQYGIIAGAVETKVGRTYIERMSR